MSKKETTPEEPISSRKNDLDYTIRKTSDIFLNAAFYSMVRQTIANAISHGPPATFRASHFLAQAVSEATEFASFTFTNGICDAIFQPNLDTFAKWVPWTVTMSALSSVVARTVQTPIKNYRETNSFSYKGFKTDVQEAAFQVVGFHTARECTDMLLPPKEKCGGKYIRSTLCLIGGNAGSLSTSLPFLIPHYPLKSIFSGFLTTIPLCFVENAIYSSVKSMTKPLMLAK